MGDYREMNVPANVHVREVITPNVNSTSYVAMISTEGKYYYSTSWGTPMFEQPQGDVSSDYSIDLAYMDSRGDVTLWDDTHKRLMNCIGGTIGYMGTVDANALAGKKALWLGRDAKTSAGDREPCLFIAKNEHNNKCYLYHISYDDKGDKMAKGDDSKGDGGEGFAYGQRDLRLYSYVGLRRKYPVCRQRLLSGPILLHERQCGIPRHYGKR